MNEFGEDYEKDVYKFGEDHEKENNLRERKKIKRKTCGIEIFQGGLGGTPQEERDS